MAGCTVSIPVPRSPPGSTVRRCRPVSPGRCSTPICTAAPTAGSGDVACWPCASGPPASAARRTSRARPATAASTPPSRRHAPTGGVAPTGGMGCARRAGLVRPPVRAPVRGAAHTRGARRDVTGAAARACGGTGAVAARPAAEPADRWAAVRGTGRVGWQGRLPPAVGAGRGDTRRAGAARKRAGFIAICPSWVPARRGGAPAPAADGAGREVTCRGEVAVRRRRSPVADHGWR